MADAPALSAAAVALLLDPKAPSAELARLAVKELVLRGVFSVRRVAPHPERRPRPGKAAADVVLLVPGPRAATLPLPLRTIDGALRRVVDAPGVEVGEAVRRAARQTRTLAKDVREECERALIRAGLVEERTGRVMLVFSRRRVVRTPSGDAWARAYLARMQTADDARALGPLVLLLEPLALARLREADADAERRARDRPAGDVTPTTLYAGATGVGAVEAADGDLDLGDVDLGADVDLGDFSALDDLGGGDFDSAFDSGSAGGDLGGGGDGGGGGGDGGGGGN